VQGLENWSVKRTNWKPSSQFVAAVGGSITFTANSEVGLVIQDTGSAADTLDAGGSGQTLTGGAGRLTMNAAATGGDDFKATSAQLNGDSIGGFAGPGNAIDLTDMSFAKARATFAENAQGTSGVLSVTDGVHTTTVALLGQFAAAGFSGSASAAGFTLASDGHTGTKITLVAPPT